MWTNYGFVIDFLPAIFAKHKHILLFQLALRARCRIRASFFCSTFNMLNILKKRIFFDFIFSHLLLVLLSAPRPQYPASAFRFRFRPLHRPQRSVSDYVRSARQASRYTFLP